MRYMYCRIVCIICIVIYCTVIDPVSYLIHWWGLTPLKSQGKISSWTDLYITYI